MFGCGHIFHISHTPGNLPRVLVTLLGVLLVPFPSNLDSGGIMPRRQINLSFTEEAYEQVTAAADAQGLTINQFSRAAVMDAAQPIPEDLEPEAGGFPAWLIALLSLLRRAPSNTAQSG